MCSVGPVPSQEIKWSESGDLLVVVCEESFFVLRYNRELVSAAFESGAPIGEEGVYHGVRAHHLRHCKGETQAPCDRPGKSRPPQ